MVLKGRGLAASPGFPERRIGSWRRLRLVWRHPANRERRLRAILRGAFWLAYRLAARRPVTLHDPAGFRFPAYPDNPSAKRMVLYGGRPDYHEMRFMEHYLRPGDGFVDVGANVGIYTLLAAALVGPGGRVEAFEPGPSARRRLEAAVAANGFDHLRVRPEAVGESPGRVPFLRGRGVGNRLRTPADAAWDAAEVPCVRLDDALEGGGWAMVKLDVEGAELLVLRGAASRLAAADPPVWLLEVNGKLHDYGVAEEELESWLEARGFDLALYDAERRRLRFGRGLWREFSDEPGAGNLLAVARVCREEVLARAGASAGEGPCASA